MPEHNWSAYEEALKANPVLAKMMISGVVYSLGDWIAQVPSHFNFHSHSAATHKTYVMSCCSISVITDSAVVFAAAAYACSATKASQSLISTVLGCSGLALLGSRFMGHFHITTTISVR
jgi:hypothetical protein